MKKLVGVTKVEKTLNKNRWRSGVKKSGRTKDEYEKRSKAKAAAKKYKESK
jgi:hypothetical protein